MDEAHKARLAELEEAEKAGTLDENGVAELKGLREYQASLEGTPETPEAPKEDEGPSFGDLKKEFKELTGKYPKVGISKAELAKAVEELKANPPAPVTPEPEPTAEGTEEAGAEAESTPPAEPEPQA